MEENKNIKEIQEKTESSNDYKKEATDKSKSRKKLKTPIVVTIVIFVGALIAFGVFYLSKVLLFDDSVTGARSADSEYTESMSSPDEITLDSFNHNNLKWTREPENYTITDDKIEIITKPYTDLWQRTYYHFRNDNAPVLQMETDEKFFSFTVKTEFDSKHRFDQCGIVMYLDSENWIKASIEYENESFQHLGSVVTNNGYSDWATAEISSDIKSMWYRFSRREDDYCIECSEDGVTFKQMRICHMWNGDGTIRFGIYACSPEDSSFKATFTDMSVTECKWAAHDGQQPDEE